MRFALISMNSMVETDILWEVETVNDQIKLITNQIQETSQEKARLIQKINELEQYEQELRERLDRLVQNHKLLTSDVQETNLHPVINCIDIKPDVELKGTHEINSSRLGNKISNVLSVYPASSDTEEDADELNDHQDSDVSKKRGGRRRRTSSRKSTRLSSSNNSRKCSKPSDSKIIPSTRDNDSSKRYWCESCKQRFKTVSEIKKHRKVCGVTNTLFIAPKTDTVENSNLASNNVLNSIKKFSKKKNSRTTESRIDSVDSSQETCLSLKQKVTKCSRKKRDRTSIWSKDDADVDQETFNPENPEESFMEDVETLNNKSKKCYTCLDCGKELASSFSLRAHQRLHTGYLPHMCSTCGKRFPELANLKQHAESHSPNYVCKLCGHSFSYAAGLRGHHLARHSDGVTPYMCSKCGRSFGAKKSLKIHELCHSETKPHSCPTCGRMFHYLGNLQQHMRVHTGSKLFPCNICENKFASQVSVKIHQYTKHGVGEAKFECKECDKKFVTLNSLSIHTRTHTDVKPHVCELCDKQYRHAFDLRKHKDKHHANKNEQPCA